MKHSIIFSNYDDIHNAYYAGGGAIAVHEVAKRLTPIFNVIVITSNYPKAKTDTIDGVKYMRIGLRFAGPKIGQILFQLLLLYYVRALPYDVWIENLTPPFSASLIPLCTRKPVIGLVHMLSGSDMQRKYHLPFKVIEKYALKLYHYFIATTDRVEGILNQITPHSKIVVIPNGVTPYTQRVSHAVDSSTILYLGRLEINQKGLDLLIKAFRIITNKIKSTLIIAGSGTPSETVKINQLIRESGLENSIIITGRIVGHQKELLFSKASCIVVSSRFETFSLTALEALSNGIPLITLPIEGLQWIPKSCRIIATSQNEQSLSDAILQSLTNNHLRNKVINNGRHFAQHFTWDAIGKQYSDFIQSISYEKISC